MIQKQRNERFIQIDFPFERKKNYAISDHGRMIIYTDNFLDGEEINFNRPDGIKIYLTTYMKEGKKVVYRLNIARAVAEIFVPGMSEENNQIIHLDHVSSNDHYNNLKWVTPAQRIAHLKKSPAVISGKSRRLETRIKSDGPKLNSTAVIRLRKIMSNPNRKTRNKIIAKQFGISVTHLHRVNKGDYWKHIKE